MIVTIDTAFDFRTDSAGKDPDSASPTLRDYHRVLWNKELPSGGRFTLDAEPGAYLVHRSHQGVLPLASDAITTRLLGRARRVLSLIPPEDLPPFAGYTVGSAILFPGRKQSGSMTINGARGFHPRIADRFDLTLECIRRFYANLPNPLADTLRRYTDFFELFVDFEGYVDFFLLRDLVDARHGTVRFLHTFDDFATPAVPRTSTEYIAYLGASNDFIEARGARMARAAGRTAASLTNEP